MARRYLGLTAFTCFLVFSQAVQGMAQQLQQSQPLNLESRAKVSYDAYAIGPGDVLQIELVDLPELSGTFPIGPDGSLYLPRLRSLYVEGLTLQELRDLLTQQFSTYVLEPQIYIRPIRYRPIRVYVGGEVRRPGFYTLNGAQSSEAEIASVNNNNVVAQGSTALGEGVSSVQSSLASGSSSTTLFPTVFDAIRTAQGITPYTDLSQVQVVRKRAEGLGGGYIRTNLNFLSLITEGDDSQNIRLYDGDVLKIAKSPVVLKDQLLKAGQSNLSPQFMQVFVTGRVINPGGVVLPQGSSLNQAITLAGGVKLIRGKIEFVRFNREGTIDRRIFTYQPGASTDMPNNPVLAAGDLIRVRDSLLSGGINLINEVTMPMVGIYSTYSLMKGLTQ